MENKTNPITESNTPFQSTQTPQKQDYLKITIIILLLVISLMIGFQIYTSNIEKVPSQILDTPKPSEKTTSNTYTNTEYKFSFNLKEGERAVICYNKNEYNDSASVWITTGLQSDSECGTGIRDDSIFVSKRNYQKTDTIKNYLEMHQAEGYEYNIKTTPITISGITGVKVVGSRGPNAEPAPLPTNINKAIFLSGDIFYEINETFLDRDFKILN